LRPEHADGDGDACGEAREDDGESDDEQASDEMYLVPFTSPRLRGEVGTPEL
jgi:hypothetical protein